MLFTQYPDLMSINDLRGALGIGRTKAYELVSSGELPSIRVGNAIRIPKTSLLILGNRIIHRVKNLKSVGLKVKNLSDWSCKIHRIVVCFPRKR